MKKLVIIFMVSALWLLTACGTPGKESPAPPSAEPSAAPSGGGKSVADYFPFEPNVQMRYKGEGNEFAEFETYVDYIANGAIQLRTLNPGTTSVNVYTARDGALTRVFSEGETYYRLDFTKERVTDEVLLKEPLETGTSWALGSGLTRTVTATDAQVTVPYGSFEAVEVTTSGGGSTTKEYYAAGLGLIKREFSMDGSPETVITSELESREENVPLRETVRVYYPDFGNDRFVYIDKPIELFTGDEVKDKLEPELKQVPENSGLTPLLPESASIPGLYFDRESGVVTVDFSKEFISDMNAGSGLEGMILTGVANTFGGYFQTDKVAVTIEGGPYESGHFLFSPGELVPVNTEGAVAFGNG
jgi:hypothetical protein